MAGDEQRLVLNAFEEDGDTVPGASEDGAEAVMDSPVVFVALDKSNDGVGEPGLERERIGAAKREDGVRIAHAQVSRAAG